jgi:hypothetical protein
VTVDEYTRLVQYLHTVPANVTVTSGPYYNYPNPIDHEQIFNAITARFDEWYENVWDTGVRDNMDDNWYTKEIFGNKGIPLPRLAKRGDVSSGVPSGSSSSTQVNGTTTNGPAPPPPKVVQTTYHCTYGYYSYVEFGEKASLPVFCGVPAWKERDPQNHEDTILHLGEIPRWKTDENGQFVPKMKQNDDGT